MRIAVTGEGPTDYGRRNFRTGKWEWGPIAAYIHNIAKSQGRNIELEAITREEIKNLKLQKRSVAGLNGKSLPARKFSILMQRSECDAGIYFCDSDRETGASNSDPRQAKQRYDDVYQEIKNGLEPSKAIPMVAMRMIECWIMSDKTAIEKVYEIELKPSVIPNCPEMIWGDKHDPNSNYPKHYFVRMIRESNKRYKDYESNALDFHDVAENSDIMVLRNKCNVSYERFYTDFLEMLQTS